MVHPKYEMASRSGSEEGQPPRVGADIAGLNAGDQSAEALRAGAGGECAAIDHDAVDENAQEPAGDEEDRGDDEGRVDLVDPVLVFDQRVDGAEVLGHARRESGLRVVEDVGEEPAEEGDGCRSESKEQFEVIIARSRGRRIGRINDGLEETGEPVASAQALRAIP